jgi:hypothetical protein
MFENVHLLCQMDYQKDPHSKIFFIEKNIDDKNVLATLKKHSYF